MAGESKRDYPASIFFQSSWYREYAQVETYFSRLHGLLQTGEPGGGGLGVNPGERIWGQIYPGGAHCVETAGAERPIGLFLFPVSRFPARSYQGCSRPR